MRVMSKWPNFKVSESDVKVIEVKVSESDVKATECQRQFELHIA